MNRSLLDTDILSEVSKAINPTVTRNATAYRQAHGHLTLSVISVMKVFNDCSHWNGMDAAKEGTEPLRLPLLA